MPLRLRSAALPLCAGVVVLVALSPALRGGFGFMDDYTFLWGMQRGTGWPLLGKVLGDGRPFAALGTWAAFSLTHTIDGICWIRLAGVVGLSCCAAFLVWTARRLEYGRAASWIAGMGCIVVPGPVFAATWATLFHGPWAMLVSMQAGALLTIPGDDSLLRPPPLRRWLGATLLLILAVCDYQPAAMGLWLVALLAVLSPKSPALARPEVARWFGASLAACGVAALVGVVAMRAGVSVGYTLDSPRTHLSTDGIGRLAFLSSTVAWKLLDPWALHARDGVVGLVLLGLLAGSLTLLRGDHRQRALRLIAICLAVPLCYLPNLASAETYPSLRSLMCVSLVIPIVLAAIVQGAIERWSRAASILGVLVGIGSVGCVVWTSGFLVDYLVRPQQEELRRARVAVLAATEAPSLTVLTAPPGITLAPEQYGDEFGQASTAKEWVPIPLTELIYREAHGHWYEHAHPGDRLHPSGEPVLDFEKVVTPR